MCLLIGRFDINLNNEDGDEERALHFNPRFYQGETVRNSKLGGDYGDEETDGGFPFEAGKVYDIGIQVQEEYYKVRSFMMSYRGTEACFTELIASKTCSS